MVVKGRVEEEEEGQEKVTDDFAHFNEVAVIKRCAIEYITRGEAGGRRGSHGQIKAQRAGG